MDPGFLIFSVKKPIVSDNQDMESSKQPAPGNVPLEYSWHRLEDLRPDLLYDLLAMREAIFVVEQNCIYQELDGLDKVAWHLLVRQGVDVIACLRVLPPPAGKAGVRIGRVAVARKWRKQGVALAMMKLAIEKAGLDYPANDIRLSAQTYLRGFYRSLGFRVCGKEFLEDGIPHVPMQLDAGSA
jgi:ElaA protein